MDSFLPLIIGLAVVLVPITYIIGQYNGFVSLRNQINEAWSNIDTELKRRYDLIPNLVRTVEAYASHERQVLDRVAELRAACMQDHGTRKSKVADENQLTGALRQMLAVVENYPVLRADAGYLKLQGELVTTEDRIQAARRFYNGNIRDYRNKFESFPTNLIASIFHFPSLDFLAIESAVREVPAVGR